MRRRLMLRKAPSSERIYLLKDGVYSPIISGFEKKGFNSGSNPNVVIGTTVKVSVGSDSSAATATTILPFDCTGYSKLGMKYSKIITDTAKALTQIALSDNVINGNFNGSFIGKTTLQFPLSSTEIEHEADISTVAGNKYLSFTVNRWNNTVRAEITVSEIWLE